MEGGEIIGEVLMGGVEMASESKSTKGCLIILILVSLLIGVNYYFYSISQEINGVITKKITKNRVLVKVNNSEDVYTISEELYLNKKINDSIKFIK